MEQNTKKQQGFFLKEQKGNEQIHMPASESHRLKKRKLLKETNKQTNKWFRRQGRNIDLARWNNVVSLKRE